MPVSKETKNCQAREMLHISGADGTKSKRGVATCRWRGGMALSDWRCVGRDNPDCPLKKRENDKGTL